MVHDHLAIHLRDEPELALADLGDIGGDELGPEGARLRGDAFNMMRAFFHLTGEVERCGEEEVGVRAPDFDARVEAAEVDLGGGEGLLAEFELGY